MRKLIRIPGALLFMLVAVLLLVPMCIIDLLVLIERWRKKKLNPKL